jgi:hypothetical protein
MATTFSVAKSGLDDISRRIQVHRDNLSQVKSLASGAAASLSSMGQEYAQLIADIDAALTAAPTNEALKVLKSEKDLLVSEFSALLTKANEFKTAVEGISF